jgi:hypothetical protein
MATEAVARQDRLHILIEIKTLSALRGPDPRFAGMAANGRGE